MTLSYRTLHLNHLPVYTEDYCGINETDSPGKEEDKSKQKESEKKSQFILQIFMSRHETLTFCGLMLQF